MAQAVMWEIFPLRMRGTAMAVWGGGIMLAPILGPTVGGWLADNWSWRWIFYINLPIGLVGFVMVSVFLFDKPFVKKPRGIDLAGLALMGLGFNSSVLLVALYTQKMLAYDAWNAGLVLAPGGLGTMISLMISGRLVARTDQRFMLIGGCLLSAVATTMMTNLTLGMDYWSLAWPRFLQGFSMGFIFVPLQTLTLATIRLERLGNATAAYNMVRNVGGSIGIALATT